LHRANDPWVEDLEPLPELYIDRSDKQVVAHELSDDAPKEGREGAAVQANGNKRYCGLRRRTIAAIATLLILAAIIGGAVGGVLGKRTSSQKQPETGASGDQAGHADVPNNATNITSLVPEPMRSIVTVQANSTTLFNFWQKQNGELWMHAYYGAVWIWADALKLSNPSLPAINNTPIAATAWLYNDYFVSVCPRLRSQFSDSLAQEVRVHYTSNVAQIIEMSFQCRASGISCDTPRTTWVDDSTGLAPGTGFAMVTPSLNMLRQYHVNSDGLIAEAAYNYTEGPAAKFGAARPISSIAKAHRSSPIAAGMMGGTIRLFWFDDQRRLQTASSIATTSTWTQCMYSGSNS